MELANQNIRLLAYSLPSVLHVAAAADKLLGLNIIKNQDRAQNIALNATKFANSLAYGGLSVQAFKDNRMLDAIAKFIDPVVTFFFPIEDINLARGISAGINNIDFSMAKMVPKNLGRWENLQANFEVGAKILKDIFNVKSFTKDSNIFVKPQNERGHNLALAGHLMVISSILGLAFKPLNRIMNLVKNCSGIMGNLVASYHPDPEKRLAAGLFNVSSAFDMVQKFTSKELSYIINNVNMAVYNMGLFFYGNLSNKRTENNFNHYNKIEGIDA